MTSQIDEYKDKIIEVLRKHDVKRASLFGSIVRGEMSSDSDIDILIDAWRSVAPMHAIRVAKMIEEFNPLRII